MKYNTIKIKNITLEYYVEYRKVKNIRYELKEGKLKLVLPKKSKVNIEEQIHKKDKWLYKKLTQFNTKLEKYRKLSLNKKLEHRTLEELKHLVNSYVEKYEMQLNVKVKRIQYRAMTRKWGSCSSLQNITLAKDLKYLPDYLVKYIVYHEMVHLIVMAHNNRFYDIIKKEFGNYKKYDEELEVYYFLIKQV